MATKTPRSPVVPLAKPFTMEELLFVVTQFVQPSPVKKAAAKPGSAKAAPRAKK